MTVAFQIRAALAFGLISLTAFTTAVAGERRITAKQPNVLFIAIDDLNHWVGHLQRNPQTRTPNIDRLAARGVTFSKAYCVAPACNPSRAALMSGLRPSTTGVYHNSDSFQRRIPEDKCLTVTLRNAGYRVLGAGKVYHGGVHRPGEWDDYLEHEGSNPKVPADKNDGVGGIKFAPVDARDEELPDYRIADWCIQQLQQQHDKPFFLACGLHKPHMPWNVPQKYFDMFPLDSIQLPPYREDDLADVPSPGVKTARPTGDHAAILNSGRWKEAIQAYLATIAYTDMNVGRLIKALDASAYRSNTIVVLWGDHGWHLGEKHHWRKFALWEEATRAPLIWVTPGVTKEGGVCARPVDFLSIFPTLCELTGTPIPAHVSGTSIKPLLADPTAAWSRPALTTHGRGNHAVRTEEWRYIRYSDGGEELYAELQDPHEWQNRAGESELATIKSGLATFMPTKEAPAGDPAAETSKKSKSKGKAGSKAKKKNAQ